MKNIYAVLDIGCSTIKLLVGEVVSANVHVLYVKKVPNRGASKDVIDNPVVVSEIIKELVEDANQTLETNITDIALVIPSVHANIYGGEGFVKTNNTGIINTDDIVRALQASAKFKLSKDEERISVIPTRYFLDTKSTTDNPVGMRSTSLKVRSLVITTQKDVLYQYIMCVENAGYHVLEITVDAYACAKEAFDTAYLNEGAVLIDIGHRSTTISFFEEGYLKYITKLGIGGYTLTKMIASRWQIPIEKAELYKIRYGTCEEEIGNEDIIHVNTTPSGIVQYTQKHLSLLLRDATEEMMKSIKSKLEVIENGRHFETVIVGGGGEIPDIDKIASKVLQTPVRTYRPDTIGAREMCYVSNLGMLYYLNDRGSIVGELKPSLELPDISNTMNLRFKGLTKAKKEDDKKNKLTSIIDTIFNEDE